MCIVYIHYATMFKWHLIMYNGIGSGNLTMIFRNILPLRATIIFKSVIFSGK